jgi:predicted transposase/invertase (TIGR01784 family)
LDFTLRDSEADTDKYFHKVKLIEVESGKVFNNKLSFKYLEMPKFNKNVEELETKFEKWMYLLQRLEFLERLPESLQHKIFEKVMSIAELLKLEKTDRRAYEESLKKHRDLKNAMDTQYMLGVEEGIAKGREEGIEKGIEKAVSLMLKSGEKPTEIARMLGMTLEQIKTIADELD